MSTWTRDGAQATEPAWRVLLGYVRPFRLALLVGAVLSLATAATWLALPLVVRELVSAVTSMLTLLDPLLLMVTLAALGLAQVVVGVVVPRLSRAAR